MQMPEAHCATSFLEFKLSVQSKPINWSETWNCGSWPTDRETNVEDQTIKNKPRTAHFCAGRKSQSNHGGSILEELWLFWKKFAIMTFFLVKKFVENFVKNLKIGVLDILFEKVLCPTSFINVFQKELFVNVRGVLSPRRNYRPKFRYSFVYLNVFWRSWPEEHNTCFHLIHSPLVCSIFIFVSNTPWVKYYPL